MLFDSFPARTLHLANRMVMAPMTRSRATPEHTPNALMATYYAQRATAGLIITEGTSPSPNGMGYPRRCAPARCSRIRWACSPTACRAQ